MIDLAILASANGTNAQAIIDATNVAADAVSFAILVYSEVTISIDCSIFEDTSDIHSLYKSLFNLPRFCSTLAICQNMMYNGNWSRVGKFFSNRD